MLAHSPSSSCASSRSVTPTFDIRPPSNTSSSRSSSHSVSPALSPRSQRSYGSSGRRPRSTSPISSRSYSGGDDGSESDVPTDGSQSSPRSAPLGAVPSLPDPSMMDSSVGAPVFNSLRTCPPVVGFVPFRIKPEVWFSSLPGPVLQAQPASTLLLNEQRFAAPLFFLDYIPSLIHSTFSLIGLRHSDYEYMLRSFPPLVEYLSDCQQYQQMIMSHQHNYHHYHHHQQHSQSQYHHHQHQHHNQRNSNRPKQSK